MVLVGNSDDLKDRTKHFALRVVRYTERFPFTKRPGSLVDNFCSGTSVGANYRAACRARSKADFVAKIGIVLEEADETIFWLELLQESGIMSPQKLMPLVQEARELTAIFVTSIRTAKGIAS